MKKTKLRIHTWPEQILKKKCRPVKVVNDEICKLLDEMQNLMIEKQGVGLAANQVGLDICLIVIQFKNWSLKLANPVIIEKEGTIKICEGCLSFPGLDLEVTRARKVSVSALDEKGQQLSLKAEGIIAVILQHEIDHINGTVFIDRIPLWKKVRSLAKLNSIKTRTKNELCKQRKES